MELSQLIFKKKTLNKKKLSFNKFLPSPRQPTPSLTQPRKNLIEEMENETTQTQLLSQLANYAKKTYIMQDMNVIQNFYKDSR